MRFMRCEKSRKQKFPGLNFLKYSKTYNIVWRNIIVWRTEVLYELL